MWSLTLTDIWSGWTESRAVWNKDHRQIVARVREIEQTLPFDLLGFDSDNGSEFITHALVRFLRERPGHTLHLCSAFIVALPTSPEN